MHPLCEAGLHVFPLVGREKYDRAGGIWPGYGECSRCGNTMKDPGAAGDGGQARRLSADPTNEETPASRDGLDRGSRPVVTGNHSA